MGGMRGKLKALAVGCLLLGCGCTSLQWAGLAPDAIREGIREGHLMQVGDRVGLVQRDGKEHAVRVAALKPDVIVGQPRTGEAVEIAIDDIVAMRTLRRDRGRTIALAMTGTAAGSYSLAILLIALVCL